MDEQKILQVKAAIFDIDVQISNLRIRRQRILQELIRLTTPKQKAVPAKDTKESKKNSKVSVKKS